MTGFRDRHGAPGSLRAVFREFASGSPPLVALGAWVVLILALHPIAVRFLSPAAEDTLRYLLLGFAIPALGLWWALRWPGSGPRGIGRPSVAGVLSLAAACAAGAAIARHGIVALLAAAALAVLQTVLLAVFGPDSGSGLGSGRGRPFALMTPAILASGFAGWATTLAGFTNALPRPASGAFPAATVVVAPLLLVLACWWASGAPDRPARRAISLAIDAAAILLVVILSIRTNGLFVSPGAEDSPLAHYHWSFIVGPAMIVRDGGWLLWDTPSPYGFLSTVALAAMPVRSVWQATYLFTAIFTPLMFLAVYLVLRAVRRGIPGQVFALLVTLGLFFAVMDEQLLYGRQLVPSTGPFRFLWPLLLLGLLALETRAPAGGSRQRNILLLGTAAWLLGCLWSFESAFYSSAVWLPGFLIVVFRDRGRRSAPVAPGDSPARSIARLLGWALLPVAALAAILAGVCAIYQIRLGHLPDFRAYVEYAIAYDGSAVARRTGWPERVPLDGLYLPVIAVIAASFAAIAVIIRRLGWPREIGLLIGATWSVWAWASYILARKDPLAMFVALPIAAIAIPLFLRWFPRNPAASASLGWSYRAITLPLLVLVALALAGRPALVANTVAALRQPSSWRVTDVDAGLPDPDPELAALLAAAAASPGDPVLAVTRPFSVIETLPPVPPGAPRTVASLTPDLPAGEMAILAPARRQVYMQRWADRHPRSGWVIQRMQDGQVSQQFGDDTGPWFWEQLFRTHEPVAAYHSEHWDVVRVEPAPGDRPRPALRDGRWLFDDTLVASTVPGVWASWGPGALERRVDGSATISDGAILNLYSDRPQTVRLTVSGSVHRGYDLVFDSAPAGMVDPPSEKRNSVDLALPAGWSRLVFTAAAAPGVSSETRSRVSAIRISAPAREASPRAPAAPGTAPSAASTASPATPEPAAADRDRKRKHRSADPAAAATPAAP